MSEVKPNDSEGEQMPLLTKEEADLVIGAGFAFLIGNKMETIDPVTKNHFD